MDVDYGIKDRVVLVTAASKGLGFATARAFAQEGARVMLASRNESDLKKAVETIIAETGNRHVDFQRADVSSTTDIGALFSRTRERFGEVDVLINNAGGPPAGFFTEVTEEQWRQAFELTLMSTVRCIQEALPHMVRNQWGRIVTFASSSVKQPIENLLLSNVFRLGVVGLSKTLATQYAPANVLINVLSPGRIATDRLAYLDDHTAKQRGIPVDEVKREAHAQIPMGRYGAPDEFARFAVFLGSAANGYMTGQTLYVDGGLVKSV